MFLLLIPLIASAQVPQGELTIQTDALRVSMTSKAGWTITAIDHDGTRLVIPAGGQGAVVRPKGGEWFGSAMKGSEDVQTLRVTVDGKELPLAPPQTIEGDRVVVTKTSVIDKLAHSAQTVFEDDLFIQKHSFKALEHTDLAAFYAFIYSVAPTTTDWLARTLAGQEIEGVFTTSKAQLVNRDASWVAQYDSAAQKGLICYYVTPFKGPGSATRIWDQPSYHKFFAQPFAGKIEKDTDLSYTMVMEFFVADQEGWKEKARAQVAQLQTRFPTREEFMEKPRLYDEGVPEEGRLTAETDHYRITFSAKQAWTIHTFTFDDKPIGQATGFYGTVLIPKDGKWIGTGHTEGGREIVHALKLIVDGEEEPIAVDKTITGHKIELIKDSTIYKFKARTTITVTDDEVIERQELEATEDLDLKLMYLSMHCWVGTTTQWIAELPDGELIQGELDNEGNEVLKDTRWCAQYEPDMGIAILTYTPKVASGSGSYTMIWDLERYHKHYTKRVGGQGESFKAGDKLDYTMIVKGVPDETGDWTATKAAAEALKEKFPPQ